ncbi:winged helix-turn-helix domain-containing protein [Nonomuraea sp. NPDC050478]|uniref:winged helix-turn-helix domain-containing protein n=1 Tax=Nonomuraea sp. NPDC050478 TaxID=3364365 RepID=UPI00379D9C12
MGDLRADPERMARVKTGARLLDVLAPLGPYWPDFLTPHESKSGLAGGLDAIMSTPRARLREEFERLAQHRRLPGWVGSLADGDVETLTRVSAAIRSYHDAAIAPSHQLIHLAVAADRAQRARDMLEHGTEGLLAGMGTLMRWRPPVLEVAYDIDAVLHLGGRGLRLVPSYFCQRTSVTLADPELPPVLIYPIDHQHHWSTVVRRGVEPLLGRTRAAALLAVATSAPTTGELARTLRISPASASRQATVLREAGLILTVRDGSSVLHAITPLGEALLEGRPL